MKSLKRATIKEELVALTGDLEKAIILNQLLYWSERVKDFDKFLMEEKMIAEASGINQDIDLNNGWIYKDMEELKEEIMLTCSVSTLSRRMEDLIEKGWIDRRRNPRHKWDKRYQYRVNLIKISMDLAKIGYILQGYKIDLQMLINANFQNEGSNLQNDDSNLQNEKSNLQNDDSNLHHDGAISEITTEITTETTTTKKEKEKNSCGSSSENNELEIDKDFAELAKLYQACIGQPNSLTSSWINEMLEKYGLEWCRNAMLIAEEQGKRSKSYVRGILENWQTKGGMQLEKQSKAKPQTSSTSPKVNTKFHNFEQRTGNYTANELEQKILKRSRSRNKNIPSLVER